MLWPMELHAKRVTDPDAHAGYYHYFKNATTNVPAMRAAATNRYYLYSFEPRLPPFTVWEGYTDFGMLRSEITRKL